MTVDKIIPCICTDHAPNSSDSVFYGMPELQVQNGYKAHTQFWSYRCPNCGRGGTALQFKSPYLALKDWNEMQTELYAEQNRKIQIFEENDNDAL